MIDPRALRTFLAVIRENSISGGARRLNISQPSVSNTIARLEQVVGTSLFDRSRKGIVLTPVGRLLRYRAEALEALLDDTREELALARDGMIGPLRVGGTPGALVSLLPQAVSKLEAKYPNFVIHVLERPDRDLIGALRKGEIELAFVTVGIESLPDDIEEIVLARDPFALIVGRANDHLPATLTLRETLGLRWVLPEAQGSFRRQIDALFINAEVPSPREAIRCDSLLTTKAIVRSGKRVTILPTAVAAAELSIGVLRAITIDDAIFHRSIGIRRLKTTEPSRIASDMIGFLRANP